jgi:uncharacterized OB-fold protein
MAHSTAATGIRMAPAVSALTEGYWRAAQERRLAIQRCRTCRRFVHFPEWRCPFCQGRKLEFEQVSGYGRVDTFTIVHRTVAPGFADRTPYVLAWVELAEQPGLRAFGNVVACPPQEVYIGLPVRVCFEEISGFGLVPNFTLDPQEV